MDEGHDVIRSRTNPSLKRVDRVARGKEPGAMLLEGERLILDALGAGLEAELLLVREGHDELLERLDGPVTRAVAPALFERLGTLTTPPGVLGIFSRPASRDEGALEAELGQHGLVLGVAGVSDPGNLGALARCAEAAGATAMVLAPGGARPFTPKALRGSMGSLLRLPVYEVSDLGRAVAALADAGFSQCVAATRGGAPLDGAVFSERAVVWMSGETGEAPPELSRCDAVTIPMAGEVESLNVTVAGALMLFAAARR
jgi:RNA methyltransferase, TrmH family